MADKIVRTWNRQFDNDNPSKEVFDTETTLSNKQRTKSTFNRRDQTHLVASSSQPTYPLWHNPKINSSHAVQLDWNSPGIVKIRKRVKVLRSQRSEDRNTVLNERDLYNTESDATINCSSNLDPKSVGILFEYRDWITLRDDYVKQLEIMAERELTSTSNIPYRHYNFNLS